jgi:hypothetical protein
MTIGKRSRIQVTKREVPSIIREVGLDISWDERKVWQLDFPIEEMDVSELIWHYDIPFWFKPGGFYDLKPQEVIDNPERYTEEYVRTMGADTTHPIDIMFWRGRWLILDGLHRLLKQTLQGAQTVKIRKIPESEKLKIVKDKPKVVVPYGESNSK